MAFIGADGKVHTVSNKGAKGAVRAPKGAMRFSNAMPSMRYGGVVGAKGPHMLHKGEMVIPAPLVKHFHKILKK